MRSAHLLSEQSEGKTKVIKQQYLPFTVLKLHICVVFVHINVVRLQQHLLFTVLKLFTHEFSSFIKCLNRVATTPTVYGIETYQQAL